MTVTCVDDAPVAVNDSATVAEDANATSVSVLGNDTDVDAGPKTVNSVDTTGTHGTVAITGGGSGLTYKPDANYCNTPGLADTFTYTLNGGDSATVSMTVTCMDDAPVAVNDLAGVAGDSGANEIDVLTNDTDVDGGPKAVNGITQPAHGVVAITGGGSGLSYQPNAGHCGADSFTYTLNGGSTATVSVTVDCSDPPTAVNDTATVPQGSGQNPIDALANDANADGGAMFIESITPPSNGTAAITGSGSGLSYQPNSGYCNSEPGMSLDGFLYTLNGGSTASVTVTVTCQGGAVDGVSTVKPKPRVKKCKKNFKKVNGKCKKKKRRKR
jgi:VCBS repeat-containing protein